MSCRGCGEESAAAAVCPHCGESAVLPVTPASETVAPTASETTSADNGTVSGDGPGDEVATEEESETPHRARHAPK